MNTHLMWKLLGNKTRETLASKSPALSKFGFTFVTLVFLINTLKANLDLTAGRFVLFMDEQITFDGVREILHPHNPFMFLYSITDGGDQRYGRLLWNISAIFSFIPERLFGESGQIVSTRVISTLFLIAASGVLARTFGKSPQSQFLIYWTMLSLPFVAYYATMPKPEPLQLFIIALIANKIIRKSDVESNSLFFLIGALLGVKISSLAVLIPLVWWLVTKIPKDTISTRLWVSWRVAAFSCGVVIAVPTLLPSVVLVVVCTTIWEFFFKDRILRGLTFALTLTISALLALTANKILELLVNRNFLMNYLNYTILGTSSGSDSRDVTPFTWLKYFMTNWSPIPAIYFVILLLSMGILICRRSAGDGIDSKLNAEKIFLISGLVSILITCLTIQRIWGFYLFIGTSILFAAALGLIANMKSNEGSSKVEKLMYMILLLSLMLFNFRSFQNNLVNLQVSSLRTQSQEFKLQIKSYREIRATILGYSAAHPGNYRAALDPNYFQIEKLPNVLVERFWGPFNGWGDYNFLILKSSHLPPFLNMDLGTKEENAKALEVSNYFKYFADTPAECHRVFCYVPIKDLPDKGEILLKVQGAG